MVFSNNAYADIPTAQAYFDGRLNTQAWDMATPEDQGKSLIQATRAIDRLNFTGLRSYDNNQRLAGINEDGTLFGSIILLPEGGQPLEFPRNGDTTVPSDVIAACCECALALLDGVDTELEMQNANRTHQGFASVRETYDPRVVNMAFRHGIPSMIAWNLLLPYLQDPCDVTIRRVN
jgi:hypothetical protein